MTPELIERLRKLAARKAWTDEDDFDPCAYFEGKYGDAYYDGREDGETLLAREIINLEEN